MSNSLTQLKSVATSLFKAKHSAIRTNRLHPRRDWLIGIGIALLIVTVIASWNTYMYLENRDGGTIDDVTIETSMPIYKAALIEQAHTVVAERATAFASLQNQSIISTPDIVAATTTASTTAVQSGVASTTDNELIDDESTEDEGQAAVATDGNTESTEGSVAPVPESEDVTGPDNASATDEESEPVESDGVPELSV